MILTEREKDVLKLLCYPRKEIGEKLFISETTVSTHVDVIYQKLNAHNSAQAIMSALKKRIVTIKDIEWNF